MVDENRQAGTEVEVTLEMIRAGADVVHNSDRDFDTPNEIAEAVYMIMKKVKERGSQR